MAPNKLQQQHAESDSEYDDFNGDSNVFSIRDLLPMPQRKDYTTAELHDLIHNANIDLDPPYQRDVVWPEAKQSGLIDSILRNFYIPPIVFAVHKDVNGEEVRVCVDGKQRLTSMHKFMDGLIPYKNLDSRKSFWYTLPSPQTNNRRELPQYWKDQFTQKKITCVEYHQVPGMLEREIFQRVQLGVTLTAAEKLQAIATPTSNWLFQLTENHIMNDGGLHEVFNWDSRRGRHFQNLAHVVYCCEGLPNEQRLPTAQKIEQWLSRTEEPSKELKLEIELVLRDFWRIAKDEKLNFGFTKIDAARVAPAEFIFIGVLLYVTKHKSYTERANVIYNLRMDVRGKMQDIRNNTNVGKVMWEFLSQYTSPANSTSAKIAKSSTAVATPTKSPPVTATKKGIKKPRIAAPSRSVAARQAQVGKRTPQHDGKDRDEVGKKRKTAPVDDDSDDEEPLAVKHIAAGKKTKFSPDVEHGGKKAVGGKKRKAPTDDFSDLEEYAPLKAKKSQLTTAIPNKSGKKTQMQREFDSSSLFDPEEELTSQEDSDQEDECRRVSGKRQKRSSSKEV